MTPARSHPPSIRYHSPRSQLISRAFGAPTTDARLKKRIVRTVIHEVVADIDAGAAEIVLLVHWVGGDTPAQAAAGDNAPAPRLT